MSIFNCLKLPMYVCVWHDVEIGVIFLLVWCCCSISKCFICIASVQISVVIVVKISVYLIFVYAVRVCVFVCVIIPGKEYGQADTRYLVSDPTILSVEILTSFLLTPICVVLAYAISQQTAYRHWLQLVLCTCELYGGL